MTRNLVLAAGLLWGCLPPEAGDRCTADADCGDRMGCDLGQLDDDGAGLCRSSDAAVRSLRDGDDGSDAVINKSEPTYPNAY